jgi:hypothetical protein
MTTIPVEYGGDWSPASGEGQGVAEAASFMRSWETAIGQKWPVVVALRLSPAFG